MNLEIFTNYDSILFCGNVHRKSELASKLDSVSSVTFWKNRI